MGFLGKLRVWFGDILDFIWERMDILINCMLFVVIVIWWYDILGILLIYIYILFGMGMVVRNSYIFWWMFLGLFYLLLN